MAAELCKGVLTYNSAFATYPFEMRVRFDVDCIPHCLDAVEDDFDVILIPIVGNVEQGII